MKKKIFSILKRLAMGVIAMSALIGGIAFLPADIEGQYRDVGARCACDSVNFLQFRDGKILYYSSAHPPAEIIGHYVPRSDRTVEMYFDSSIDGRPDQLLAMLSRICW